MSYRPTTDEISRQFAVLEKAKALANTEATQAMEQYKAAAINPRLLIRTYDGQITNETANALLHSHVVANDKRNEIERAMTKLRKQAWKWYRVTL